MAKPKGIIIKYEWLNSLMELNPTDFKLLISSMIDFKKNGVAPPEFYGVTKIVADNIFKSIKRTIKNQKSGSLGGNPKLLKSSSAKAKSNQKASSKADTSLFDRFWSAYPKKVGKDYAKKCFLRLTVDEGMLEEMLKAIEGQKATEQWKQNNGQFIPNPSTWLNQGRWKDEIHHYDSTNKSAITANNFKDFNIGEKL